jgi:ATP-binding cassette subfamily B protein
VINAIYGLSDQLTIIMIAHRLSTVEKCDKIYQFLDGKVISEGTYRELMQNSKSFQDLALQKF